MGLGALDLCQQQRPAPHHGNIGTQNFPVQRMGQRDSGPPSVGGDLDQSGGLQVR
jgi:hypothetical protein